MNLVRQECQGPQTCEAKCWDQRLRLPPRSSPSSGSDSSNTLHASPFPTYLHSRRQLHLAVVARSPIDHDPPAKHGDRPSSRAIPLPVWGNCDPTAHNSPPLLGRATLLTGSSSQGCCGPSQSASNPTTGTGPLWTVFVSLFSASLFPCTTVRGSI